jgi:predicted ribosomally synthesized peptide with SipW-like signal peptide
MSEKLTLSRRKLIAGLGTIGIASSAAGYGTYAAFSDQAQTQATFTAGELDGKIAWSSSYNGERQRVSGDGDHPMRVNAHPEDGYVGLNVQDLKPGDYGSIVFEISVDTNPAWVFSCLGFGNNVDNGLNAPESRVDDTEVRTATFGEEQYDGDDSPETREIGNGELAQNMLLIPFYDADVSSNFFDSDVPDSFNPTNEGATSSAFWSNAESGFSPRDVVDIATSELRQGTVEWSDEGANTEETPAPVGNRYEGCVLLNGAQAGTQNQQGFAPLQPVSDDRENVIRFGYDWHLPFDVGNEAQTDQLTLYFGFDFQQYRHNASPARPYISTPGYGAQGDENEGDA